MISSLSSSTSAAADFFSRIDTNSDGQATADELKTDFESRIKKASSGSTSSANAATTAPDFATMVSEGDTDGDGTLSEVEFTTAMQARHQMPPPPPKASPSTQDESSDESSLEEAISSIDTDGDGKLSAAELAAAYLARTEATDETDDAETDESDSSTTAESTTASTSPDFESLVALVDTDGDGLLNSDELSTLVSDSRRAQQPPPPPSATPPELAWTPDADTTSTSDIGQA